MKAILAILITLTIFGCNGNKESSHHEPALVKIDTLSKGQPNFKTLEQIEQERERLMNSNYSFLDKMLDTVLKIANNKKSEFSFSGKIDSSVFHYREMNASF